MVADPVSVLKRLSVDVSRTLGADLRGFYAYGSWVEGDFSAGRSDLDLLAVLAAREMPHHAALISWARRWWYDDGSDAEFFDARCHMLDELVGPDGRPPAA